MEDIFLSKQKRLKKKVEKQINKEELSKRILDGQYTYLIVECHADKSKKFAKVIDIMHSKMESLICWIPEESCIRYVNFYYWDVMVISEEEYMNYCRENKYSSDLGCIENDDYASDLALNNIGEENSIQVEDENNNDDSDDDYVEPLIKKSKMEILIEENVITEEQAKLISALNHRKEKTKLKCFYNTVATGSKKYPILFFYQSYKPVGVIQCQLARSN